MKSSAERLLLLWRCWVLLLTMPALAGCAAVVTSDAKYAPIELSARTAEEVQNHLGPPARREQQAVGEVWHYLLDQGLTGDAWRKSTTQGLLMVVPFRVSTAYADNLRLRLREGVLVAAEERAPHSSAFGCGIGVGHGLSPACDAGPIARDKYRILVGQPDQGLFEVAALPEDCGQVPRRPINVACAAHRFLRSRKLGPEANAYRVYGGPERFIVAAFSMDRPTEARLVIQHPSGLLATLRE